MYYQARKTSEQQLEDIEEEVIFRAAAGAVADTVEAEVDTVEDDSVKDIINSTVSNNSNHIITGTSKATIKDIINEETEEGMAAHTIRAKEQEQQHEQQVQGDKKRSIPQGEFGSRIGMEGLSGMAKARREGGVVFFSRRSLQ